MLRLSQGKGTNMSKKFNLLVFAKFLFISFLFVSCKGADGGFAPDGVGFNYGTYITNTPLPEILKQIGF